MSALNNYRNALPNTVILADDRDPFVSWLHHVERAGRGGVDIVAAVGTPVYARTSGRMQHIPNNGSAGNSSEFAHDSNPGYRDVFSHLSSYVGESGDHFNAGDVIAYTGNTGGVVQHLHWHLLDPAGVRRNPWAYFSQTAPNGNIVKTLEERFTVMAKRDFDITFVEQNQDKDNQNYLCIMAFGSGVYYRFAPNERDVYNRLRNLLNKLNHEAGNDYVYPDNATSIGMYDWDAIERVYNPNYGR